MIEFAGNLPRTFIGFRCFEKKSNVRETSQYGEDQRVVSSPTSTSAEAVQIPEADTSPVKTMTVLYSAGLGTNNIETTFPSMERVTQEVVKI